MACARATALFSLALLSVALTTGATTTAAATTGIATAADYCRPPPSPAGHKCGAQGTYAPDSAYEANLRLLAATVPAQANASGCRCSPGDHAGERPDMVATSVYCYWRPDAGWPSDCGACISRAFGEAQRLCPYHRQAMVVVDGGECSVSFHDVQQREQSMGLGRPGVEELKNFTERVVQASTKPECLTM
nr:unnamed protein product [Digitaria exilis]